MYYFVLFLSGILTAVPFINQRFSFLAWFSLAPLFYAAQVKKSAYLHGLAFGAGFYGTIYYWFVYLYPLDFAGLNGAQSAAVVAVAWVGMTLLQSVGTAFVPLVLAVFCHKRGAWYVPFAAASAWTLAEWVQTQTWMGVPWGRLAVSQYSRLEIIQSASLLGSLFVGFLIALVNAFIAQAFITAGGRKRKSALTCAAFIFAGNFIFGAAALNRYVLGDEQKVKVALIQGNISSGEKWSDDSLGFSLDRYKEMTLKARDEYAPDIIIWPETVIPAYLRYEEARLEVEKLARDCEALIFAGAYDAEYDEASGEYSYYNAIMVFTPDGELGGVYYKRHLVPFGEYLPMAGIIRALIPPLAELNVFENSLTPGDSPSLISTEFGDVGGLVCFDSIYETLALDSVRGGAGLIVLATNDSWYRDSPAVYQHNGHAVLRAVECGRYVTRAANTGVSSIIRPNGSVYGSLPPLVSGNLYGEVSFTYERTLYSRVGNVIVPAAAVILAVSAGAAYDLPRRIYNRKKIRRL